MKSLEPYIISLLRNHDCVVIPGFGGLVTNVSPACYHAERNLYLPPYKNFTFNRNLEHNDGLLCNTISQKAECSYAEAYDLVRTEVRGMLRDLRTGRKVVLNGVGSFNQDKNGHICFSPLITINFLLDSFGLQGVILPEINQADMDDVASSTKKSKLNTDHTSSPRKYAPIQYMNWAAAAASVVFMFFLSTPVSDNSRLDRAIIGYYPEFIHVSAPKTSTTNVVKTNTAKASAAVQPKTNTTDSKQTTNNLQGFNVKPVSSGVFYVIIGSFPTKDQADSRYTSFAGKKIENLELIECGNRFRVSCGSFTNRAEADRLVSKIKSQDASFADAWVFKSSK